MAQDFVARSRVVLDPPPGIAKRSTDFAITTTIGGTGYQFEFSWNSKYGYYSVGVVRSDDKRIEKLWPETGEWNIIRNFHLGDGDQPDALLGVVATNGSTKPMSPGNLGGTHHLVLMRGRVVKA